MHEDFIQLLKKEGYFQTVPISELHGSCCISLTIPVIPFNPIKEKFCGIISQNNPKSVNALFFSDGDLVFIQTEQYYISSNEFPLEKFHELLQSRHIEEKIEGTIEVLKRIVFHYGLTTEINSYVFSVFGNKIKTIILTDLTERDFLKLRIANYDKLKIVSDDPLLGEIIIMICDDFQNSFE